MNVQYRGSDHPLNPAMIQTANDWERRSRKGLVRCQFLELKHSTV